MEEESLTLADVCSDSSDNNIKDDKSNYIQFTRKEDKLMYNVWYGALSDCISGQSYVRDIIDGFAHRTSCFANETAMLDDPSMYVPVKQLNDVTGIVEETGEMHKEFCTGESHTPDQTTLTAQLAALSTLVAQWDNTTTPSTERLDMCREMLAAHTMAKYAFVGILKTTRPAACNATAPYYDEALCQGANTYLHDFLGRDLFVDTAGGEHKGQAADGENEHGETCKAEILGNESWFNHKTTTIGITVDEPLCTVDTSIPVFTVPVLKVGVWHENIGQSLVADAYRYCGCPFVAGISATMPKYISSTAASNVKKGHNFIEAISLKEILTLMSMLELSGFHAVTGLTLSVNFYYKELVVTPPFDSGDYDSPNDGEIRCHDHITHCCTNETKNAKGFYNNDAYSTMIAQWQYKVKELWGDVLLPYPSLNETA
jgi:hypothetical protein